MDQSHQMNEENTMEKPLLHDEEDESRDLPAHDRTPGIYGYALLCILNVLSAMITILSGVWRVGVLLSRKNFEAAITDSLATFLSLEIVDGLVVMSFFLSILLDRNVNTKRLAGCMIAWKTYFAIAFALDGRFCEALFGGVLTGLCYVPFAIYADLIPQILSSNSKSEQLKEDPEKIIIVTIV